MSANFDDFAILSYQNCKVETLDSYISQGGFKSYLSLSAQDNGRDHLKHFYSAELLRSDGQKFLGSFGDIFLKENSESKTMVINCLLEPLFFCDEKSLMKAAFQVLESGIYTSIIFNCDRLKFLIPDKVVAAFNRCIKEALDKGFIGKTASYELECESVVFKPKWSDQYLYAAKTRLSDDVNDHLLGVIDSESTLPIPWIIRFGMDAYQRNSKGRKVVLVKRLKGPTLLEANIDDSVESLLGEGDSFYGISLARQARPILKEELAGLRLTKESFSQIGIEFSSLEFEVLRTKEDFEKNTRETMIGLGENSCRDCLPCDNILSFESRKIQSGKKNEKEKGAFAREYTGLGKCPYLDRSLNQFREN